MRSHLYRLVCLSALLFTASASADQVVEKPVASDTPDKFASTIEQIRHDMQSGGRYEYARPDEKANVNADLDAMAAMLQKSGSVSAMSQQEKVQLFNKQEHVNGILTHTDSNRLICEHHTVVGSTIPRTTCDTLGEIEHTRRATRDSMNQASLIGNVCANPKYCRSN
ncbi:MAG: hypothetical protein ABJB01_09345 [Rudaea sp.]